ncbi:hypothetical protein ES705_11130 [subsurface metagenome]
MSRYFKCEKCESQFVGWGVGDFCGICGNELKEIGKEEFERGETAKKRAVKKDDDQKIYN